MPGIPGNGKSPLRNIGSLWLARSARRSLDAGAVVELHQLVVLDVQGVPCGGLCWLQSLLPSRKRHAPEGESSEALSRRVDGLVPEVFGIHGHALILRMLTPRCIPVRACTSAWLGVFYGLVPWLRSRFGMCSDRR